MKAILYATALLAGLAVSTAQATTLTTLPQENDVIYSWGLPDTAAYGQTFTLGSAATLNNFAFRINDLGTSIDFVAYVFGWDTDRTVGSALLSVAGATLGSDAMTTISVAAGNLALGAGQYVAFLQAKSNGDAGWGSVSGSDAYSGGAFVFQNNTGDESQFGTVAWESNWQGPGSDLAFSIKFDAPPPSAIPLPAGLPLMVLALGGLGLAARRKRRAA